MDSTPGESFKLNINTVEEGEAEAEDGSQRDGLATFAPSPVAPGIASSMDISPGQGSFGFNMQQVRQERSAEKKQDGLGELIQHMDQDQLRQSYTSNKSVQQRAADKIKRQSISSLDAAKDPEQDRSSSKGRRA